MENKKDDNIVYWLVTEPYTTEEYNERKQISNQIPIRNNNNDKDDLKDNLLMNVVNTCKNTATVENLINAGADIYATNKEGSSALSLVIKKGQSWLTTYLPQLSPKTRHIEILKIFFQKVRYDYLIDQKLTIQRLRDAHCPLALIPFMKSPEITKYFLENNVLEFQRIGCLMALHITVLLRDLENIKILIDCEVNVNAIDGMKQTALFLHSMIQPELDEKYEVLKILLNNNSSLYVTRSDGMTLMEYLLKYGDLKTQRTVLTSNADFYKNCGMSGDTALHLLIQNRRSVNEPEEEIKLLVSRGFDINTRNNKGINALTFAIERRFYKVSDYLIKHGAEVDWLEIVENTTILESFTNVNCEKNEQEYYKRILESILTQQGITIQHLTKKVNEEFPVGFINLFYIEIIIAHLAIAESMGKCISNSVLERFTAKFVYKEIYEACKDRIVELKTIRVDGSVTLYQLLVASNEEIDAFICDPNSVSKLENRLRKMHHRNLFYLLIIRKRIEYALQIVEMKKSSGRRICELMGLIDYGIDGQHFVVYKILSYLSRSDIVNIFEGETLSDENSTSEPETQNVFTKFIPSVIMKQFYRSRR